MTFNTNANEENKLNEDILEEIDKVIAQASNTNEPPAYDENVNLDSELGEMNICMDA